MAKQTVRAKMRSQAGFTLAETLIAIALLALLTIMVIGGINAAVRVYTEIRMADHARVVLNNAVTEVSTELRYAHDVGETSTVTDDEALGTGVYAFDSGVRGFRCYLRNSSEGIELVVALPKAGSGYQVESDETITLADGNAEAKQPLPIVNFGEDEKLVPYFMEEPTYDNDTHTWKTKLGVSLNGDKQNPVAQTEVLCIRSVNTW